MKLLAIGVLVLVQSVFAQDQAENRQPPDRTELTAAEIRKIEDALALAREVNRQTDRLLAKIREELAKNPLVQFVVRQKIPAPIVIDPPLEPTLAYCVPRGVAWMVSRQGANGLWARSREIDALATLALSKHKVGIFAAQVGNLRIGLRRSREKGCEFLPTDSVELRNCSWRELAIAIYAECEIEEGLLSDSLKKSLVAAGKELGRRARSREVRPARNEAASATDALRICWTLIAKQAAAEADLQIAINTSKFDGQAGGSPLVPAVKLLLANGGSAHPSEANGKCTRWASELVELPLDGTTAEGLEVIYVCSRAFASVAGDKKVGIWRGKALRAVLNAQRRDGAWGKPKRPQQRRVRSTALALLCLSSLGSFE